MTDQNQVPNDEGQEAQDVVTIRASAPGMPATDVSVKQGSTLLDIYNQVAEQTAIATEETRIVHNNRVVDPDEAEGVTLQPGDEVDLVRETENG